MDQEVDNISEQEFKLGYWFFLHRDLFKKIITWFLAVVVLAVWGYSAVKWVQVLATNKSHEQMLISLSETEVSHNAVLNSSRPMDIETVKVSVIPSGKNYDVVVEIKNPNLKWGARDFAYDLTSDSSVISSGRGFILPLENKFLSFYNIDLPSSASKIEVTFKEVDWSRIKDFKDFRRPNFTISDQQIDNLSTASGGTFSGTRLKFDILNGSPYSFWQVDLTVLLNTGGQVLAVATQPVRIFNAGESKTIEINWPTTIPYVSDVVVKADVNTLSEQVFK